MEARKNLEKSIAEGVAKKKYKKLMEESGERERKLRAANRRLRTQLEVEGKIPPDSHDIDDDERRQEAIREVETC
ncbi:17950_t:CDS:2 [Entrophospora sp. SA101]|nr:6205_t:CDS:2 [Entrophospora sp. SA101]CAJ0761598.1 17950_t:CDS:2 [Entrophospora sp. SA101]